MASPGAVLVLALAISIGGGLLLYAMVEREHDQRETTDWETGERVARRDSEDRRQ